MHIPVTAFAAAVSGLLLLFLGMRVSMLRMQHQVALGDGGLPALVRAIRVHASSVEQLTIFLIQCACYEIYLGASPTLIALVGVFLLARLIFAFGLSLADLSPARRLGAALTYLVQLALSLSLLAQVVATLF